MGKLVTCTSMEGQGRSWALNVHAALARSQNSNTPLVTGDGRAFLGVVSLVAASEQIGGVASFTLWGLA